MCHRAKGNNESWCNQVSLNWHRGWFLSLQIKGFSSLALTMGSGSPRMAHPTTCVSQGALGKVHFWLAWCSWTLFHSLSTDWESPSICFQFISFCTHGTPLFSNNRIKFLPQQSLRKKKVKKPKHRNSWTKPQSIINQTTNKQTNPQKAPNK